MSIEIAPGRAVALGGGVTRITAPNPGAFTGPGTNSYWLDTNAGGVFVDPGPALDAHFSALCAAANGAAVAAILVTHTHPDHSPLAMRLAAHFSAPLVGLPAPEHGPQDRHFKPDLQPDDGALLGVCGDDVMAIHTPGHASNHVCYLHRPSSTLLTGDHINQGSTVVIDPPDGHMGDYLASLRRLLDVKSARIAPGHGVLIDDPAAAIHWLIEHRCERERKVLERLRQHMPATAEALVAAVYDDVDARLHPIALRSLNAHLAHLREQGLAAREDGIWRAIAAR